MQTSPHLPGHDLPRGVGRGKLQPAPLRPTPGHGGHLATVPGGQASVPPGGEVTHLLRHWNVWHVTGSATTTWAWLPQASRPSWPQARVPRLVGEQGPGSVLALRLPGDHTEVSPVQDGSQRWRIRSRAALPQVCHGWSAAGDSGLIAPHWHSLLAASPQTRWAGGYLSPLQRAGGTSSSGTGLAR